MKTGVCWGCNQTKKVRQVILFDGCDPVWLCKKCDNVNTKFKEGDK